MNEKKKNNKNGKTTDNLSSYIYTISMKKQNRESNNQHFI